MNSSRSLKLIALYLAAGNTNATLVQAKDYFHTFDIPGNTLGLLDMQTTNKGKANEGQIVYLGSDRMLIQTDAGFVKNAVEQFNAKLNEVHGTDGEKYKFAGPGSLRYTSTWFIDQFGNALLQMDIENAVQLENGLFVALASNDAGTAYGLKYLAPDMKIWKPMLLDSGLLKMQNMQSRGWINQRFISRPLVTEDGTNMYALTDCSQNGNKKAIAVVITMQGDTPMATLVAKNMNLGNMIMIGTPTDGDGTSVVTMNIGQQSGGGTSKVMIKTHGANWFKAKLAEALENVQTDFAGKSQRTANVVQAS